MHRWRLQNGFIIPLSIVAATAMIVSFYPDFYFATADYLSDYEEYEEKKSESVQMTRMRLMRTQLLISRVYLG